MKPVHLSHDIRLSDRAPHVHTDCSLIGRSSCRRIHVSTTLRVSKPTRDRFARLAQATGRPMSQLVDEAADALERRVFFDQLSTRYETLRDDDGWTEVEAERKAESGSLRDRSQ